ncbi:MAG: hypothetical protein HY710_14405 [Candidatus Latescibacteria bacterium]|nr:hypothetical protein [Candidatus Latescibacterota bacterium]
MSASSPLDRFRRHLIVLSLCLLFAPRPAHAADAPSRVDGRGIATALTKLSAALNGKPVDRVSLDELLSPKDRPVAERHPDARLRFLLDIPVDSVLTKPEVNIIVFFEDDDHLEAELWKVFFAWDGNRWAPQRFKPLLRSQVGYRFRPTPSEVYRFDDLTIRRDSMVFHVTNGFLVPASADGRIGRAVIVGQGEFTFTPSDRVERQQLKKFSHAQGDSLTGPFTRMVVLLSPDGYRDLTAGARLERVEHQRVFKQAQSLLRQVEKDYTLTVNPLKSKWSFIPTDREFFQAEFDTPPRNWLVYSYNPAELEEVSLVQKTEFPRNFKLTPPVLWCHFTKTDEGAARHQVSKAHLHIERYGVRGIVAKNKKTLTATTTVEVTALADSVSIAAFFLNDRLNVRRVTYADGEGALFIHEGSFLAVPLLTPLRAGERTTLTFQYDGDIIQQPEPSSFAPLYNEQWLPRHSDRDAFHFDLEMRVPHALVTVATGEKQAEWDEPGYSVSRWQSTRPINLFGVIFSEYRTRSNTTNGVNVTVYAKKDLQESASREKEILQLVDAALPFYSGTFGTYPFSKLDIIQMPDSYGFGQGVPSLLMLWGIYFRSDYILDRMLPVNERFRVQRFFTGFLAHEIAHQWWGNIVVPRTYRDNWLAEGLATYAADLFIEQTAGQKQFHNALKDHVAQATQVDREGAISLGTRLKTSYQGVVYDKGAMVFHMLRQVCGDERFFSILTAFYQSAFRGPVTTADFKKVVERVMDQDMAWFFDQWITDIGFPVYRVEYTSAQDGDGQYYVRGMLVQQQSGRVFTMPVPLRIRMKDGKVMDHTVWNNRRSQWFEVSVPEDVKRIDPAPDSSVYCQVE